MKATMHSNSIAGMLLTIVAVFACSSPVCAQSAGKGNFVLPFEVQWNGATLSAGQYSFTLQPLTGMLFVQNAQRWGKLTATAISTEEGRASASSTLIVVRRNGKWHVSTLALGPLGRTLVYVVPRGNKLVESEMGAAAQGIPVQIGGR